MKSLNLSTYSKLLGLFRLVVVSLAIALTSCADPSGPLPPTLKPSQILTSISLNIESAIAAVGDSLDFQVKAVSLSGDTLPITGNSLEWGVSDASVMRIDQNGRAHMLKASGGNVVSPWVRWTSNGITRTGAAYIVITQNRDPVTNLEIRPKGDSVRTALPETGICCGVSIIARNATGDSLGLIRAPLLGDQEGLTISYFGPAGVTLGLGQYLVGTRKVGPFWLYTEALVYGTMLRDSIQMMGLYPLNAAVTIKADPTTAEISSVSNGYSKVIQPCGSILFINQLIQPVEIIFDDTSKVSGCVPGDAKGNIASFTRGSVERKISSGTVRWTARVVGSSPSAASISGTVITREP